MTEQTEGRHEPSAAERAALHGPPPAADPTAEQAAEPQPEPPGPCEDCMKVGKGDLMLAVLALGVATVIAIMAIDLMTGGRLGAVLGGPRAADDE